MRQEWTDSEDIRQAVIVLRQGGVIAYPTEAVYGLGCDPKQKSAVMRLLKIKQRSLNKGLILVGASWAHLEPWCETISPKNKECVLKTWPGPHTWLFPVALHVPKWITGSHFNVAIRISAHPVVQALCNAFEGALVSTSANCAGQLPLHTAEQVKVVFEGQIDYLVTGAVGGESRPTSIRDAISGAWIRL